MRKIANRFIIGLVVFLTVSVAKAQDTQSNKIVEESNSEYVVHTVEPKQTLYAISKMYSIDIEDIEEANPILVEGGLKIGQTLRIPVKHINKKEAKKAAITLSPDTIYHEVLKKETLYALTKKYNLSQEELYKYNPNLKEGLKIGMVVKIPIIVNNKTDDDIQFELPEEDSLQLHEVQPKETLYSLSKLYKVSIDSLQMVNDGLKEGLKVGTSIRIPIPNKSFNSHNSFLAESHSDSLAVRDLKISDTLKIGVFLPFCTAKNLEMQEANDNEDVYVLTKISLEFMRGIEAAVDSLNKLGYHVSTQYFDTKNDTAECRAIVSDESLENLHFFIGPLYQVNFKIVAEKAQILGIPIISPVKISSRLLLDNKYVIKAHASSPSQVIYEAQYVGKKYVDSNLVLFSGGDPKDKRYSSIYQKYVNNAINDSIAIHRIWTPSMDNFKRHLKIGQANFVAIISSDEAFVASALSVFYRLSDEKTSFTVFGLDSWKGFGSIDYDYLMELRVTYPVQQHINYSDKKVIDFVSSYRAAYYTEPSLHVFSAYDIAWYFGYSFFKSNGFWETQIANEYSSGLSLRFQFVKIGEASGFENRGGYLLENSNNDLHLIY